MSGQGAKIDCSNLAMIQVDIIQMDDYPTDSCAISPMAFLLKVKHNIFSFKFIVTTQVFFFSFRSLHNIFLKKFSLASLDELFIF